MYHDCTLNFFLFEFSSGSGIFNSSNPEAYARAIVEATTHYNDPLKIAEVSTGLGAGIKGENDLNREGLVSTFSRLFFETNFVYTDSCPIEMSQRGY